jgi:hypothetical protein
MGTEAPAAMVTLSPEAGTTPLVQAEVAFQLPPVAEEVILAAKAADVQRSRVATMDKKERNVFPGRNLSFFACLELVMTAKHRNGCSSGKEFKGRLDGANFKR